MALRRVRAYPLKVLTGVSVLSVPVESIVINAVALNNTAEIVHLLVAEPVLKEDEETEYENLKILTVNRDMAFTEPEEEDQVLSYVGSPVWDNGHRTTHVFVVDTLPEEIIDSANYLVGDDDLCVYAEGEEKGEE